MAVPTEFIDEESFNLLFDEYQSVNNRLRSVLTDIASLNTQISELQALVRYSNGITGSLSTDLRVYYDYKRSFESLKFIEERVAFDGRGMWFRLEADPASGQVRILREAPGRNSYANLRDAIEAFREG